MAGLSFARLLTEFSTDYSGSAIRAKRRASLRERASNRTKIHSLRDDKAQAAIAAGHYRGQEDGALGSNNGTLSQPVR
jgi:hypothetical protein